MDDCFSNRLLRDRKQGPQGRSEAKISAESIRLSRMLSGCRAEQKPPGAGRSSAGRPAPEGQSSQLPGKMDGRLSRGLLRGRKIRPGENDMNGKTSADRQAEAKVSTESIRPMNGKRTDTSNCSILISLQHFAPTPN